MDAKTVKFLTEHLLEEYVSIFAKNKIGITEIKTISNEDLAALIEPIGDRQRFKTARQKLNVSTILDDKITEQQESLVSVLHSQPVLLKIENLQSIDFDSEPPEKKFHADNNSSEAYSFERSFTGLSQDWLLSCSTTGDSSPSCQLQPTEVDRSSQVIGTSTAVPNTGVPAINQPAASKFIKTKEEIYYVAPYAEGKNQKISKGKLPYKHRNMRTAGKKNGSIEIKKANKECSLGPIHSENLLSETELVEKKTWLLHFSEPWTKVLALWHQTAPNRLQQLINETKNGVTEIFKEWPLYKAPLGYTLIAIDFKHLYEDKELAFLNNWPVRREKIVAVMKQRLSAKVRKLLSDTSTDGSEEATILRLLPAILPPTVVREGKQSFKPTVLESQDQFVLFAKTAGDASIALQQRRNKFQKLKRSIQPLVIVVGETMTDIMHS